MTQKEHQRAHLLIQVQHGTLQARIAAQLLGLSLRHLRRLLALLRQQGLAALAHGNRGRPSPRRLPALLRQQGLAALAHGNRGRPSPRRLPEALRARVLTLARTRYADMNDHHFTEVLVEREGLRVSRRTVQRLLRAAGIGSPRKRRPPRHRSRRERMPQAGLLLQMDGSHHPWLEDRGPRLVLRAAIDDATSQFLGGVFRLQEDAHGYFLLLHQLIRRYGLPSAAYTDRHGIFHRDPRTPLTLAEQLQGRPESTQVGRVLQELGIRWIGARSPQAKGRIERLFGTFQDRLVIELRLAQACTLSQAQRVLDRFLPRYNARFTREPAHPAPAWRPAPPPADLSRICCFKYQRTVQHDNTVQLDGRLLQIHPGPGGRSYARTRVEIHAHLDGTLAVYYRGQRLAAKALPPEKHPMGGPRSDSLRANRIRIPLSQATANSRPGRGTFLQRIIPGGKRP